MIDLVMLGLRSLHDLFGEFSASVTGSPSPALANDDGLICGNLGVDDGHPMTRFFLDPRENGDCAGSDLIAYLTMTVIVHIISWTSRWFLWQPLGNWYMQGHKTWNNEESQKFSQTVNSLSFFTTSAILGWLVLNNKYWLYQRQYWTNNIDSFALEADFKFYYLFYGARFMSDVVSIFFEHRTKEAFISTFIHHIVTIGLILISAHVGYTIFGGVIMFFFDWGDIPLLVAKSCKYLSKKPNDTFQWLANRFFEIFAVVFFVTRCCIYSYVVWSGLFDLPKNYKGNTSRMLLVVLLFLQIYWMGLIVKAAQRQKKNSGNIEDVREDKDTKED